LLLLLEDDSRPLAGGSMDAQAGGFLTPTDHLLLDMLPIAKAFSFEEILPDIGDLPYHGRFPLGMSGQSGIQDKPSVLRILQRGSLKDGSVTVRFNNGRSKIIDHQTTGDAPEEAGSTGIHCPHHRFGARLLCGRPLQNQRGEIRGVRWTKPGLSLPKGGACPPCLSQ